MCLDSNHVCSELQAAALYHIDPSRRDVMAERHKAVRKGCHACLQLAGTLTYFLFSSTAQTRCYQTLNTQLPIVTTFIVTI